MMPLERHRERRVRSRFRYVPAAALSALLAFASGPAPSGLNQAMAAEPTPFRCPGAALQFPVVDGYIGWLYSDVRSIGTDDSYWHTGIDVYPKVRDEQALVYPLARGELHQVNLVPNSTKIYYKDQGITSYLGHIVLDKGLHDGSEVFADKPIGRLLYQPGNTHLHLSMKYTNGWQHYNDQALFDEKHPNTAADDPSDAFNAYLLDHDGTFNPWQPGYPPYIHPYDHFCRTPGQPRPNVLPSTKPGAAPGPSPAPAPAQAQAVVAESIAAMRGQQRIELRSKTDLLMASGSARAVLSLPDGLDGEGDAAGVAWSAATAGGRTAVTINGEPVVNVTSKGVATQVRDILLGLPMYASDWTGRLEKGSYRLEGRIPTGGLDALLREIGADLPGTPRANVILTVDERSKLWQTLQVVLLWPVVDYRILGQEVVLGPAASTFIDLGNRPAAATSGAPRPGGIGEVLGLEISGEERELAHSTAEGAVTAMGRVEALKPLAQPLGLVFTILNLRTAVKMLGEAPQQRASLQAVKKRYAEDSVQYDDALRRYREWQYRMPLVGPFLPIFMPKPVSSR